MPVDTALGAMEECGTPMVSIAGGEPLLHPEIGDLVEALVERRTFVYLCTNGLRLEESLDRFTPSPYFSWVVHVDGLRERHDASVRREGVFDTAVAAIRAAGAAGFSVMTNTTMYASESADSLQAVLDFLNDELRVDAMMLSPAFEFSTAGENQGFLGLDEARDLCRATFAEGRRRRWRLNHSPLFLDLLEGRTDYDCTPWAIPCYSVLGWQRPCYLRADGYCDTYAELIETTDWSRYGHAGGDPQCRDCLAHCGFEPTAVIRTMSSPRQSLRALLTTARAGP
jgi:hopanoid biosynthesis associated radical SAM protein HpnH